MFNIGDKVVLDPDLCAYDLASEDAQNAVGVIVEIDTYLDDFIDDEPSIFIIQYLVNFGNDSMWVLEDEITLYRKAEKRQTGFSKFIKRIESDTV